MRLSDKIARQADKLKVTISKHFSEFSLAGFAGSSLCFAVAGIMNKMSPEQVGSVQSIDYLISAGTALGITAMASLLINHFKQDFKEISNINRISNESFAKNLVQYNKQTDYQGLMVYVKEQLSNMTPERQRELVREIDKIDIEKAEAPFMMFLRDRTLEARHPELQESKSSAIELERQRGWNFMKM